MEHVIWTEKRCLEFLRHGLANPHLGPAAFPEIAHLISNNGARAFACLAETLETSDDPNRRSTYENFQSAIRQILWKNKIPTEGSSFLLQVIANAFSVPFLADEDTLSAPVRPLEISPP